MNEVETLGSSGSLRVVVAAADRDRGTVHDDSEENTGVTCFRLLAEPKNSLTMGTKTSDVHTSKKQT